MKAILGKKVGMTQIFDAEGKIVPVTVIEAGPCVVTQKKTKATDGYEALQIGFGAVKEKHMNKARKNHLAKSSSLSKVLREVRFEEEAVKNLDVGQELSAAIFTKDELVSVRGCSIGKGFQGGIKRWNFNRQRMTHGCKARRLPGSMAAMDRGGKIPKGKKMAGHLGDETVTISNIKVIDIEGNLLLLRGAVPGAKNGVVYIFNKSKLDISKLAKPAPAEPKKEEVVAAPAQAPASEVKSEATDKR
jgi:large subunit ribosomal protein L3